MGNSSGILAAGLGCDFCDGYTWAECGALPADNDHGGVVFKRFAGGEAVDIGEHRRDLVVDGEPVPRRTPFDIHRAIAGIRASDWPGGEEFIAENLLVAVTREEAIAAFESQR